MPMPSRPAVLPVKGPGSAALRSGLSPAAARLAISTAAKAATVSAVNTHCNRLE
ncbi:hypothetical protein LMG3410_06228 [Achromobacter aegrifaciens]|nr:hypothetical protein LMG3410_06228 [Achromobacter aegrifaciens]